MLDFFVMMVPHGDIVAEERPASPDEILPMFMMSSLECVDGGRDFQTEWIPSRKHQVNPEPQNLLIILNCFG